jgi:uncharacterized protein YeaO (DUF488 family)
MAEEVRLWRIENGTDLKALTKSKLDLEGRLESLLDGDVSVLSDDVLVIGRQTTTAFGGVIDLLCLDRDGDVIIVELKRDKTPRDITAQTLDYASWVKDLSRDDVVTIADKYLAAHNTTLEEAFQKKFNSEMPEVLNENHRMLIVASEIDTSSERIINYLSDQYGVDINAATFHYFKTESGEELLARIFLIQPEAVKYKAESKGASKRRPYLTLEQLQQQAEQNEVGDLYRYFETALSKLFSKHTTVSSVAFNANFDGSRRVFFSLKPSLSSPAQGLYFQIYDQRIMRLLNIPEHQLLNALPENRQPWKFQETSSPDGSGYEGFFIDQVSIDRFVSEVGQFVA